MIEDILDKDSSESAFIQVCDFISYFYHCYYKVFVKQEKLPYEVRHIQQTY